jgi:hypothetical protein
LGRRARPDQIRYWPFLDRRQRERKAYVARQAFPTRGDKGVRAQSIRGRMALEGLYVPTKAPWYPAFRSELLSFPAGKHDDIVDALGLVGQLLDRMQSGQKPPKPEPPDDVSGYVTVQGETQHRRLEDVVMEGSEAIGAKRRYTKVEQPTSIPIYKKARAAF